MHQALEGSWVASTGVLRRFPVGRDLVIAGYEHHPTHEPSSRTSAAQDQEEIELHPVAAQHSSAIGVVSHSKPWQGTSISGFEEL